MKILVKAIVLALTLLAGQAMAVTCTSKADGDWNSSATWTCTGGTTKPASGDSVILVSPYTVSLNGNDRTAATLTINTGATLDDDGQDLTVNGNVVNNGTFGTNGGALNMQGVNSTLSGDGTFDDTDINIDATGVSLPVGSTMTLTNQAQFRVGNNNTGTFTLNGTLDGTGLSSGDRVMRVYQNSRATVNGSINAPNAYIRVEKKAAITNAGSVSVQYIDSDGNNTSAVWTQAANAALTLSQTPASKWRGTLNATATDNTVTFNSPATPIAPSSNTYFNLTGSGVTCPHGFVILGTSPCAVVPGLTTVTGNPGTCVNATGIGSVAWAPTPTSNVNLSDALYATASVNGTTNYLKCTGYSFAIPAGATILGVMVNLQRKASKNSRVNDAAMRLVKAGVIGATNRSQATTYTTTDVYEAHGNASDLWGTTWTPTDINATTFGAALAVRSTKSRTVYVNHMPISVTYSAPAAAPHHIQIEHSGAGKTCAPEQLIIKACVNAACTAPHFTATDVTGNLTWAGSPGGTLAFSITGGGSGQTTVSLPVTTAQTVTLGISSVNPTPTVATPSCTNLGGGSACQMVFASSSLCLDAVEVGQAVGTPIFTKLASTAFTLDVKTSSGSALGTSGSPVSVAVELVNASTGSCGTYSSLQSQNVSFNGVGKKSVSWTYAGAVKQAKVRMTAGSSASCSSDDFVIRPQTLVVDAVALHADITGASVSATPVVKAGVDFAVTATAIAGYTGQPTVDNALLEAHTATAVVGGLTGAFTAAATQTGVASGTFSYKEVGYFKFGSMAVTDTTFAAIDTAKGDCALDSSNTLDANGHYGCNFGNTAASDFLGRFIPDHFRVLPDPDASIENRADLCANGLLVADGVTACTSPAFSYLGEPMNVKFQLIAETAGATPTTTQNYDALASPNFAKFDPLVHSLALAAMDATVLPSNCAVATCMTPRLVVTGITDVAERFQGGTADLSAPISVSRGVSPDGPYAQLNVGIAPVDSDGVGVDIFDLDTDTTTGVDHALIGQTAVYFGRLKIGNAYGSESLTLPIKTTVQYYNGTSWVTSSADSLSAPGGSVNTAGVTGATLCTGLGFVTTPAAVVSGLGSFTLTRPTNGRCSADVTLTAPGYLPSLAGRATFGVYKSPLIYRRENY
ncbi:MAG: hypothetical protein PHH58_10785 [Rhodoferax sp.]|nr:hypothetical protein [Rhodoferax sp.]